MLLTYRNPYRDLALNARMRSYGGWKWTGLPKGPGAHTPDAIREGTVYFLVHKAGKHSLEIAHRSSTFAADKILRKRNDPTLPSSSANEAP